MPEKKVETAVRLFRLSRSIRSGGNQKSHRNFQTTCQESEFSLTARLALPATGRGPEAADVLEMRQ